MTTFLFISIIFLLCFIVLLKFFFEYQERKHETELQYEKYCTTILVAKERATVESDLYRELLVTREKDNERKFDFIMQFQNRQIYTNNSVNHSPTLIPLVSSSENGVKNAVTDTVNAVTVKFTFPEVEEGITKTTYSSSGLYIYKGNEKDFCYYPTEDVKTQAFKIWNLFLKRCKQCNSLFVCKSDKAETCGSKCKQAYHRDNKQNNDTEQFYELN